LPLTSGVTSLVASSSNETWPGHRDRPHHRLARGLHDREVIALLGGDLEQLGLLIGGLGRRGRAGALITRGQEHDQGELLHG
jgi:hypothetical protein